MIGLKQKDTLFPMLFNLALKKTIRELQETTSITIREWKLLVLGFADDLNILESLLNDTKSAAKFFEQTVGKVGLKINRKKTKLMKLLENEEDTGDDEDVVFEKVNKFQYLGAMLNVKKDWNKNNEGRKGNIRTK